MKLTIFDRKKYIESINKLRLRKAPNYIIEAYKDGYAKEINIYYRSRLAKRGKLTESLENKKILENKVLESNLSFLKEALSKKDYDFIKLFFTMSNMDIMSGNRMPPNASNLIKQGIVKDLGLQDLFKKLRKRGN